MQARAGRTYCSIRRPLALTYPEFETRDGQTGELLNPLDQAMLAYYFALSDGTPDTGDWISFSDLPDGHSRLQQAVPAGQLDRLVPQFILLELPSGARGLLFAALLAAAMSSLDSALNSLSASTVRDFIEPALPDRPDDRARRARLRSMASRPERRRRDLRWRRRPRVRPR